MSRKLCVLSVIALLLVGGIGQRACAVDLECLTCHSAPGFRKHAQGAKEVSLHVDVDEILRSVHASKDCVDCHADLKNKPLPHGTELQPVQCLRCHREGNAEGAPDTMHVERYADSVHGSAAQKGDRDAPDCKTCHGNHDILKPSDPRSSVFRANVPATCGKCHFSPVFVRRHGVASTERYKDSIHAGVAAKGGSGPAAVCTDCHGVHDIGATDSAASRVSRQRLPKTCGKCHTDIYKRYVSGIHGKAVANGIKDAPTCTDCHGEHTIQKHTAASSSVYPTHVVATCSKCHEDMRLQHNYALPANRLASYINSYHGIANKFGDVTVANCATCHGAHDILPSSDPRSAVNKRNLPKTCGSSKCHPGAGENWAKGSVHVFPLKSKDAVIYWVGLLYGVFVWCLIGSFCMYILLDLQARRTGRLPGRRKGGPR